MLQKMGQIKLIVTKEQGQNAVHAKGKEKTYVEFTLKTLKILNFFAKKIPQEIAHIILLWSGKGEWLKWMRYEFHACSFL